MESQPSTICADGAQQVLFLRFAQMGLAPRVHGDETRFDIPAELGGGETRFLHLNSDIQLEIIDKSSPFQSVVPFQIQYNAFRFTFYLDYAGEYRIFTANGEKNILTNTGTCTFAFFPELKGRLYIPKGTRNVQIVIHLSPTALFSYFKHHLDGFPREIYRIAAGEKQTGYFHAGRISPIMRTALHEIMTCPYSGSLRQIYMQGKALELVTHKLARIQTQPPAVSHPPMLPYDDVERIHHAKHILSHDLEKPPDLFSLARAVGLTHTKLNRGFREVYGTTVFNYLRQMRLSQAKYLMEKQGRNVTEAALMVGYKSLPSFSKAFSQHFKMKPSACLKKQPYFFISNKN